MAEPTYLSTEQYVGERYIDTDNKIIFINEDCAGWPQHEKMLNNILAVRESNYQTHVLLYKGVPDIDDVGRYLHKLREEKKVVAATASAKKTLVGAQITAIARTGDEMSTLTPRTHATDVTDLTEDAPPAVAKPCFDVDCPTFATQSLTQMGWMTPTTKSSSVAFAGNRQALKMTTSLYVSFRCLT